jgi:hypothetical protein
MTRAGCLIAKFAAAAAMTLSVLFVSSGAPSGASASPSAPTAPGSFSVPHRANGHGIGTLGELSGRAGSLPLAQTTYKPALEYLGRAANGTLLGRVVAGGGLYVREYFPDTPLQQQHFRQAHCDPFACTLPYGTVVQISCQVANDWVDGAWGWTNVWDVLAPAYQGNAWWGVSSDGWLYTGTNGIVLPSCSGVN